MTIIEAINHIDAVKPNVYSQEEKIKWLSILDGIVKAEIIDTHEGAESEDFKEYDETTPLTQVLLVHHPYDELYVKWLEAQIDYASCEYKKYNNSITLFDSAYVAYSKYYNRTHKPIKKYFTNF
jgi:hypothetical protein